MTIANIETGQDPVQQQAQIQHTEATLSLTGWATELDAAYQLAQMICTTAFVPQHFRGKPEETAVAMLYGHTLGLPPMVAVKSIYVVHGTPALYAQTMYAIALSMGHQIERVHADDTRVEFRARRRGQQQWQPIEWTIERARKAKYTSNGKYQENPIGMLTEKCKAEAAKLVAADALAGMNSVEEIELGDFDDASASVEPEESAPAKPKTRVTRKRKDAAPDPVKPPLVETPPAEDDAPEDTAEGEPDGQEGPEEPVAPAPETITKARWDEVKAALAHVGVTTLAEIRATLSDAAGRPIQKWQDLTPAEADEVEATIQDALTGTNDQQED